jgi:small subunit ribosomal protein S2
MSNISISDLFSVGAHFGHMKRFRNPKMKQYIFATRNNINIIDLDQTYPKFLSAIDYIRKIANQNGKILFVGTKKSARKIIAEEAQRCNMPYVNYRWLGGMLTNYNVIKKSISKLNELEKKKNDGTIKHLTKKEGLNLIRNVNKLNNSLSGIKNMERLPDVLFIVDVGYEKIAVKEARHLGIPIIGIVDTNSDPSDIDFVIPGNDDAMRAIKLYASSISNTIINSKINKIEKRTTKKEDFIEINNQK